MHSLKWPVLIFLRYYRHLGLRVSLYALLSLIIALISPFIESYLSNDTTGIMDFGSVIPVLTILATSMLAVSTFSLNVMVTAHRAAADMTTPRVHRLLLEDTTTQSVLAVFIGAFVYSLTSIVMYQAGLYADSAAIVVMAVTIAVVVLIIVAMLRWIQHLSSLGSVDDSLRSATKRAQVALTAFAREPALGATRLSAETVLPDNTAELRATHSGYLQLIDVSGLEKCLPERAFIYVIRKPGAHVLTGDVVAHVSGDVAQDTLDALLSSFVFGDQRTYEQDAAFGLLVLSEIASKALSPGINDSGTAIEAILRMKALLWDFSRTGQTEAPPDAPRVFVPVPDHQALLDTAFSQVAREGAGKIEVAVSLRDALLALSASADPRMEQAARVSADLALGYSEGAGLTAQEMQQLHDIDVKPPT